MTRNPKDEYSKEETERRFLAALHGARIVGHKPLKDIPKKNGESRTKPSSKTSKGRSSQSKKRLPRRRKWKAA